MGSEVAAVSGPDYKDRSVGLAVFGFLLALLGCLAALMTAVMLLSTAAGGNNPPPLRMMIPAIVVYALVAVLFVWLGVGSILARRWARALILVLAWMWLAIGVLSFVMVSLWMPSILDMVAAQGNPAPPPQAMLFVQVVMLATMGCFYLLLPGMLVLFYRSKHVKATCEARDPRLRWTDKCPLPVLSLCLLLALGAISMLMMFSYGPVIPFFGVLLKGVSAVGAVVAISLLFALLAWGTYKLKIAAWWMALLVYVGFGVSAVVTFLRVDLMEYYREMQFPADQLELIEKSGMLERMQTYMPFMVAGMLVVFLVYMLWIHTYFRGHDISGETIRPVTNH